MKDIIFRHNGGKCQWTDNVRIMLPKQLKLFPVIIIRSFCFNDENSSLSAMAPQGVSCNITYDANDPAG